MLNKGLLDSKGKLNLCMANNFPKKKKNGSLTMFYQFFIPSCLNEYNEDCSLIKTWKRRRRSRANNNHNHKNSKKEDWNALI